jgi:hypothetical protein
MMSDIKIATGFATAVLLIAVSAGGCGSGSSDSTTSSDSATQVSEPAGSTAPSSEFVGKTGNNTPGGFGHVASAAEREAASKVLEENLRARAAGDWAGQCATLTVDKQGQAGIYAPSGIGCAQGLKVQAEPLSASKDVRADTMTGPIAVLRVEKKLGYALYHGKKHQDYAMLMKKEGGQWKVAHLATNEVP